MARLGDINLNLHPDVKTVLTRFAEAAERLENAPFRSIEKLHVIPGDILVVSIEQPLPAWQLAYLRKSFETQIPGVKCLVLPPGIKIESVLQSDPQT